MEPNKLKVRVNEKDEVTALLYHDGVRNRLNTTLILGHGAGANQLSPFMVLFASELSKRGLDVITFNFVYKEQGRSAPDPKARLEACYQAVIDAALAHRKLKENRLAIGGKSMGGRIASQVAAVDGDGHISKLVLLGYPLHPPGKPDQLRDEHLKDVKAPMLFIQGTRDPFGSPEELKAVTKKLKSRASLYLIDGGDHSLKVPKSAAMSQQEVYDAVMKRIVEWLS